VADSLTTQLLADLAATSAAEGVAVFAGLVYVVLTVQRNRWCWLAGGISSLILAVLAAQSLLPMQAVLQAWYVAMSAYGWLRWSDQTGTTVVVWGWRRHLLGVAVCLLLSVVVAAWVASNTNAAWPLLDTATTAFSLFATWQVARMVRENWLYWIVIDAVSLVIFAAQGLVLTSLLFAVYLLVAGVGYATWWRQCRELR
jgi:nicotinamide mononucleotide transporter